MRHSVSSVRTGGPWVNPSYQLDQLFGWVADIAVQPSFTGQSIVGAFAPQVDLRDDGVTDAQRLAAAGRVRAAERLAEKTRAAAELTASMDRLDFPQS